MIEIFTSAVQQSPVSFYANFDGVGFVLILVACVVFAVSSLLFQNNKETSGLVQGILWGVSFLFAIFLYFEIDFLFELCDILSEFEHTALDSVSMVGMGSVLPLLLVWLIFGAVIICIGFLLRKSKLGYFILMVGIAPIVEEIFYRYFLLGGFLSKGFNLASAVFLTAVLFSFSIYHVFQNIGEGVVRAYAVPTLFYGVIYAYVAISYGLIFAVIIHVLTNLPGAVIHIFRSRD